MQNKLVMLTRWKNDIAGDAYHRPCFKNVSLQICMYVVLQM